VSGRELSHRFYSEQVRPRIEPVLGDSPHAAAMLGDGSDVLGFDDDVSPDHDFGPRVQIVIPPDVDPSPVLTALRTLPTRYDGLPVYFTSPSAFNGWTEGVPGLTAAGALFRARLGFDPADGITLADWLTTPTQLLATMTAGPVFHDPAGLLTGRRTAVRWYPDDVWRYALAAGWLRVDQEQPFVGRTGGGGDDLGSAILTARQVREHVKLAFLVERRWAPYGKWLGRAFAELSSAGDLGQHLSAALAASSWRQRERHLCQSAARLVEATNDLRLADPVDPAPGPFFDRDILVAPAQALVLALTAAVTDPALRRLIDGLGGRSDQAPRLPGTIDQAVDSVDVLTNPRLRRASGPTLGLPAAGDGGKRPVGFGVGDSEGRA